MTNVDDYKRWLDGFQARLKACKSQDQRDRLIRREAQKSVRASLKTLERKIRATTRDLEFFQRMAAFCRIELKRMESK